MSYYFASWLVFMIDVAIAQGMETIRRVLLLNTAIEMFILQK